MSYSQFGKFLLELRLAVTLTFDLDLELLWSFGRHVFKLCLKFEQNRTIRRRLSDDLAHYRSEIFEGVAFARKDLRGAWTKLHQTLRGHMAITCGHGVCFRVEISCSVFKRRVLKIKRRLSDVENEAKIRTFGPL